MAETFEDKVERIAKAWFERPCPPGEREYCNPALHVWENGHPEDREWARNVVRFTLERLVG